MKFSYHYNCLDGGSKEIKIFTDIPFHFYLSALLQKKKNSFVNFSTETRFLGLIEFLNQKHTIEVKLKIRFISSLYLKNET